ncbi:MAG: hypothetical protein CM15mP79_2980 [Methanobacteriota archaeon]|nr:MAG: hypothetical protein CM15mP79_2980 [Euryarchaeota archaeon]
MPSTSIVVRRSSQTPLVRGNHRMMLGGPKPCTAMSSVDVMGWRTCPGHQRPKKIGDTFGMFWFTWSPVQDSACSRWSHDRGRRKGPAMLFVFPGPPLGRFLHTHV